jgi:hypothetical protein
MILGLFFVYLSCEFGDSNINKKAILELLKMVAGDVLDGIYERVDEYKKLTFDDLKKKPEDDRKKILLACMESFIEKPILNLLFNACLTSYKPYNFDFKIKQYVMSSCYAAIIDENKNLYTISLLDENAKAVKRDENVVEVYFSLELNPESILYVKKEKDLFNLHSIDLKTSKIIMSKPLLEGFDSIAYSYDGKKNVNYDFKKGLRNITTYFFSINKFGNLEGSIGKSKEEIKKQLDAIRSILDSEKVDNLNSILRVKGKINSARKEGASTKELELNLKELEKKAEELKALSPEKRLKDENLKDDSTRVLKAVFSPDGSLVATYAYGVIKIWDMNSKCLKELTVPSTELVGDAISWGPRDQLFFDIANRYLIFNRNDEIVVFSTKPSKAQKVLSLDAKNAMVGFGGFRNNSLCVLDKKTVSIIDIESKKTIGSFIENNKFSNIAYSSNANVFALWQDYNLKIYEFYKLEMFFRTLTLNKVELLNLISKYIEKNKGKEFVLNKRFVLDKRQKELFAEFPSYIKDVINSMIFVD